MTALARCAVRRVRSGVWIFAVAAAISVLAGCDPCSGIVSCEAGSHVAATGQLIVHESGEPVPGVALVFRRTGGVDLENETVAVTTDRDGRFLYRTGARGEGTVLLEVEVSPPDRPAYRVEELVLRTRSVRGDGVDLGRWVVNPYFVFLGELRMRSTGEAPRIVGGRGARVVFRPTGGVPIERDSLITFTDSFGRFLLQPRASGTGIVEGSLSVHHPDLPGPHTVPRLEIESDHVDRLIDLDQQILVGPPQARVRVSHGWTGGTQAPSDTFTAGSVLAPDAHLHTFE